MLNDPPIAVSLPLADPTVPAVALARPAPSGPDPAGQTRVRGRVLDGAATPLAGLHVEIDLPLGAFTHHAVSDDQGEFVYVLTGFVPPEHDGTGCGSPDVS